MNKIILKKAWKIMRRNYGCPGPDGVPFQEIKRSYDKYASEIENQFDNWNFENNYYKKTITDYLGNRRDIYIYNILSRWAQQYMKLVCQQNTERILSQNVYSYTALRNLANMNDEMEKYLGESFLRIDIKRYFLNIDVDILKTILSKYYYLDRCNINLLLKFVSSKEKGLPQGNVLSPYLSNLYLTELDIFLNDFVYFRYSDDMYILVRGMDHISLKREIERILKKLNLKINNRKTKYIDKLSRKDLL